MLESPNIGKIAQVNGIFANNPGRRASRPTTRGHLQYFAAFFVGALLVIGFLASLIGMDQINPKAVTPDGMLVTNKNPLYYICHAFEIATLLTAGGFSLLMSSRNDRRTIAFPMAAFLIAAVIMTVRGLSGQDMLSTKILGATAIVPCLLSILIIFGMNKHNNRVTDKLLDLSGFLLTILLAMASVRHTFHTRQDAVANLQGYLIALYVPAVWQILKPPSRTSWIRNWLRFAPITAYAAGSLLTQTRLNLLLLVPILGIYLFVQSRRGNIVRELWLLAAGLAIAILVIPILLQTRVGDSIQWSILGLQNRLSVDTRTGQINAYFADLDAVDLVFGRGTDATYLWAGRNWHGGIDVGYLALVLYGGMPLMISYLVLHILPGLRALRCWSNSRQLSCAGVVVLWGIRLLSTGYMDYNAGYYCLLLCVGGCFQTWVAPVRSICTTSGRLARQARAPWPIPSHRQDLAAK
jgi:hypothetical protein